MKPMMMLPRRGLIGGALAAPFMLRRALAQTIGQPPSLSRDAIRNIAQPMTIVSRQRPLMDGQNTITAVSGSNTANVRQFFQAPPNSGVTDIVLKFPGFYENQPEVNLTTGYTVTAAIEYPLGTFTQCLFNGATSQAVAPGHLVYSSDPVAVYVPPGATAAVKLFLSWTGGSVAFPLTTGGVNSLNGEWCAVGTGLTDQTLSATVQTNAFPSPNFAGVSIACGVYGRTTIALPCLGIVGDSVYSGYNDWPDSIYGAAGFDRALRTVLPVTNLSRLGELFTNYLGRNDGRSALLHGYVTHVLMALGRNDISNNATAVQVQGRLQSAIGPFLARGIKVYAVTITPVSTSTDAFLTVINQSVSSVPQEAVRQTYNAWLRANWASIGLSGIFDTAHAVDPGDTGVWPADGTTGRSANGVATLTGGAISSVAMPVYSAGTAYGGQGYPISQAALPCVVTRYPDDPIRSGDATVTCATNGTGVVTSFAVVTGGSYGIPPMISPTGIWTLDGTHPVHRSLDAMIAATGFGVGAFSL
jgi:hypothetical protein